MRLRPASALLVAAQLAPALALGAAGPARPGGRAVERRAILDRHGHAVGHLPPQARDAACAPELYGAVVRAGLHEGEGPVHTRIDGGLQVLARGAVHRAVERLARTDRPVVRLARAPAAGQRLDAAVRTVLPERLELDLGLPGWTGVLALPAAACDGHSAPGEEARFQPGERVQVRVLEVQPNVRRVLVHLQPQAALVALDPRTRDVLALVGGHGLRPGDFDRATQGRRQAGSTWKPLVYAAALASRRFRADDLLEDLPRIYGDWQPRNYTGTYRGLVTLREALAHSVNTVAVHLLAEVGPAAVVQLAERLGIPRSQVPRDLTQALGTALVSPLQLAGAYGVFADTLGGRYAPPRLFGPDGGTPAPGDEPALPPALAYLVTDLLHGVVVAGSGRRAQELGVPGLAGKTGTTSQGNDAWFVGYHADLLAVAWVGDDEAGAAPGVPARSGADTALPLWLDFMRGALAAAGRTPSPPPRPPGLVEAPLPGGGRELHLADTP